MERSLVIAVCFAACSWSSDLDARFSCPDNRCPANYTCLEGRCEPDLPEPGPAPAWWDPAWQNRSRLRIHNRSEQVALAGLPVVVRFELAELEIAGVDELQLAYHDGTQWTRLPVYWVYQERFADALWFRLPADIPPLSADDGVWIYAGNPNAPPYVGDGISVWEQHDYFDDIGPSWVTEGNVSLIDNSVRLGPGGVLRGLQTWPVDHAVDVALVAPTWPQGLSIGFQRSADFEDSAPLARWTHQGVGFVPEIEIATAQEPRWTGGAAIVADNRVELGVDRWAGGVRFWLRSDVATERALTGGDYLEPLQIRVANVGTTEFDLAQLRVRRTMNPLPHVTRAELEPQP